MLMRKLLKYSRNYKNKDNTFLNYSNFQNASYRTNEKILKSDILFNNSAYTPKAPEINSNKSFIINKNEEEKINKDNEKYIDCLNSQTYKLDSQIDQLQNKVFELNIQNIKIEKD